MEANNAVTVLFACSPREQCKLKKQLITDDVDSWLIQKGHKKDQFKLHFVGGVDISFVKDDNKHACAALVILSYPELKVWGIGNQV